MSKVRNIKRTIARTKKVKNIPVEDEGVLTGRKYRVSAVVVTPEVSFLDENNRTMDRKLLQGFSVFEAAFFPGLVDFLRSKNLERGLPPKEEDSGKTDK